MDKKQIAILDLMAKYKNNFPLYGSSVLKVKSNDGRLLPFKFNPLQQKLNDAIEKQKAETGKVRVIVLKSRKLGISTYSAARFIHQTTFNKYKRCAVITHVKDSTDALFDIYKRFYDNLPPFLQPKLKKDNQNEIVFGDLDSSIKVATAGAKETGRGDTFTHFHASEIGFWPNDYEIAAGMLQSIANVAGTEIIIESTPNGLGNLFHSLWEGAIAGENGYLPIFFGWSDDPSCTQAVPDNFEILPDEKEYAAAWKLTPEQIFWRRIKIKELGFEKFTQEYPISAAEAFRASSNDSFIPADLVLAARKRELPPENKDTPLILGVDVATKGKDHTVIVWRRGDTVEKFIKLSQMENDEVAAHIIKVILEDSPAKIFIDGTGGYGGGVCSCLRMRGYESEEIHFSASPTDPQYANKRAEIYGDLREWLKREVSLPDSDEIETDLTAFGYRHNTAGKLLLESKDEVKKRIKRSPDIGDAIALTFSYPLGPNMMTTLNGASWQKVKNRNPIYLW